jgi:hypothetical protein
MRRGKTSVNSEISTGFSAVAGTDYVLAQNLALINDMTDYTRNPLCPDIQHTERAPGLAAETSASSVSTKTTEQKQKLYCKAGNKNIKRFLVIHATYKCKHWFWEAVL